MAQPRRHLKNLFRLLSFRASLTAEGKQMKVALPALTSDQFDRTGNLSAWRVQHLLIMARLYAFHTASFLDYDKLTQDRHPFIVSLKTDLDRSIYTLPDRDALPPCSAYVRLGHVGTASLNTVVDLVDDVSGCLYATNVTQVVMVNPVTRKPSLIPDWWKERYLNYVSAGGNKLVVNPVDVPTESRCHGYVIKVTWSDLDYLMHTTYSAYVKFCFAAAMDAAAKGFFSQITGDVLVYPVKSMLVSFHGESVVGNELLVKCWESEDEPYTVHFDISHKGRGIFQNHIHFFPS